MKTSFAKILLVAVLGLMPVVGHAHLIDQGIISHTGPIGNLGEEATFIENHVPLSYSLTPLGKHEYDDADSSTWTDGSVSGIGASNFTVSPDEGDDVDTATVSWNLTGTGYFLHYILVKDGRNNDEDTKVIDYHLYEVHPSQGEIGTDEEVTINFAKGISHISFFGSNEPISTPDCGATFAMLGAGFLMMAAAGRRFIA